MWKNEGLIILTTDMHIHYPTASRVGDPPERAQQGGGQAPDARVTTHYVLTAVGSERREGVEPTKVVYRLSEFFSKMKGWRSLCAE